MVVGAGSSRKPTLDAIEEPGGVIVGYGEDGEPVTVEFPHASVRGLIRPGEVSVTPGQRDGMRRILSVS